MTKTVRSGRRRRTPPRCVICGGRVVCTKQKGKQGRWGQTCGIACSAFLAAHPELTDHSRNGKTYNPGPKAPARICETHRHLIEDFGAGVEWAARRLLNSVKRASVEEWFKTIPSLDVLVDEEDEEEGEINPWARNSRRVVALYLEAAPLEELPRATLTFTVPRNAKARGWILNELFGGEATPHWDILLAWRCRCDEDHRVIYQDLDDFPTTPGYHDHCPRCGCAPVEVIRER